MVADGQGLVIDSSANGRFSLSIVRLIPLSLMGRVVIVTLLIMVQQFGLLVHPDMATHLMHLFHLWVVVDPVDLA